jgi:hypothetical protein
MKMLLIQFDSIVNLIQMKLMKVSYKMRNMMIQEFQSSMKFQLIRVMTIETPRSPHRLPNELFMRKMICSHRQRAPPQ